MPASFHRSKTGMQSHNLRIAVSAQEDKPIAKCQELVSSSAPYMSHPSHLKPRGSGREFHIRKDRIKSARYPHLRSLFDHPLHFAHDFVPIFPLSSAFGTSCTKGRFLRFRRRSLEAFRRGQRQIGERLVSDPAHDGESVELLWMGKKWLRIRKGFGMTCGQFKWILCIVREKVDTLLGTNWSNQVLTMEKT